MRIVACSSSAWPQMADARALPRNFASADVLPERTTSVALGVPGPISRWNTQFLFDYRIFPQTIMRFDAEWRRAGRAMSAGDIIIQRTLFPPIGWGVCLQFAVRVTRLIDGKCEGPAGAGTCNGEEGRRGFAYETLVGHVESGVSEFYFEERTDGLHFTIHTFSCPAHWTSRLLRSVFTEPYQAWCTRRALEHVRRTFLKINAVQA